MKNAHNLPLFFVTGFALLGAGYFSCIYLIELLEFSPFTSMILEYNNYVLDLTARFPHVTPLEPFMRYVYILSGPVSALIYLLPFTLDLALPWTVFIQRALTTGLNILALPFIFRIARRRLDSGCAAALIAIVPVLFPLYSVKLATDIAGPGMLFAALAMDSLDRRKFGLFRLFLALMSLTHPVSAVCGLIWLVLLYFSPDRAAEKHLKKAFPLQILIANVCCLAVITILAVNPENALGGTPYSSKTAIIQHVIVGNFLFAGREILEISEEILLLFLAFLLLPLIKWRYVATVSADIVYYFFTQTTFHGDLPAVMFFLAAGAIEGLASLSRLFGNPGRSAAFQMFASSAMLIAGLFLALNVEDRFGNRTLPAVWGLGVFDYERTWHAKAIEECLSRIPEGSTCVAPQALAPFIGNAKRVWSFEMVLESGYEGAEEKRDLLNTGADCFLLDKERLLLKNLETDDMKYRIAQNALYPLSGTFFPYSRAAEEASFMERIAGLLVSHGVKSDIADKIRTSSGFACNNDGLILVLSKEK